MSWPTVALKEESSVITKGTTPTSLGHQFSDDGVPFLRAQNLVDGTISVEADPLYISEDTNNVLKRSKIQPDDVLISIAGTIGRASIVPSDAQEMNCNQAVAIVRPSEKVNRRFLLHWLSSQDAMSQVSKGKVTGVISNLSLGQIGKLKIPLPPLGEQKRIAAILDQADALRRLRQRSIDRLNTLGQAIFHEMFGDWRDESSQWPIATLGERLDFLTSGSRGWAKYYSEHGVKFIRIQNVRTDYFDDTDMAFVQAPDSAESRRTKVQPGDVLLSITADLGRTAVVPNDIGDAHINQHLAILRANSLNSRFLSSLLATPACQQDILKRNREGVKAGLNFDDVRGIRIIVPPHSSQDEYERRILSLERSKGAYLHQRNVLSELFAALQNQAFRGEL